jgi:hypothetical protein
MRTGTSAFIAMATIGLAACEAPLPPPPPPAASLGVTLTESPHGAEKTKTKDAVTRR